MVDQQTQVPKAKRRRRGHTRTDDEEARLHTSVLFETHADEPWYKYGQQLADRNTIRKEPNSLEIVQKYRTIADAIYRREVQLAARDSSKDDKWVESTLRQGTLKDRIAAHSVVVSTDPIHKLYALDSLLSMVNTSNNSRVAQLAAEAVEDLFVNTLLPPDRKLVALSHRVLQPSKKNQTISPRLLVLWRLEEVIQEKCDVFVRQYLTRTLHEGALEQLEKISAIRTCSNFLRSVPEQEQAVLSLLVNKLGDPAKKVCAAASHELRRVLAQHPAMQSVVTREVQQLAHRPQLSAKALYNCVVFLNQSKLTRETPELTASLMSTYFRLFEVAMERGKKKKEQGTSIKSRLLSALLTGVNRAHPYLPDSDKAMDEHVDAVYRIVHTAPPASRTQALLLLFHLAVGTSEQKRKPSDDGHTNNRCNQERFYRALYSTLSDSTMLGSGKHLTMFFNLLYKAMKNDTDTTRIIVFAKRILSTAVHCTVGVTAASVYLLNEVGREHPVVWTCYQEVLSGLDALRVFDPCKREPRGALVSCMDEDGASTTAERRAPGWELTLTIHHYHPSVRKFADSMGDNFEYTGDPLIDFSLVSFLDKFAYRNPKSAARNNTHRSVAQRRRAPNESTLPVNDPSFVDEANVGVADDFFHTYFVERVKRDEAKGIVRKKHAAADEEATRDAELRALDREEQDMEEFNFDDFECKWDSDEDEEAFVDSLARKVIEDSTEGEGSADLDNEDPDMDEWGDMYAHDDEGRDQRAGEDDFVGHSGSDSEASDKEENEIDADTCMDKFEYSDSDEDHRQKISMAAKSDSSQKNLPVVDELELESADGENDLALLSNEESESSDNEAPQLVEISSKVGGSFAAAEDYEELINKTWSARKRHRTDTKESMPKKRKN